MTPLEKKLYLANRPNRLLVNTSEFSQESLLEISNLDLKNSRDKYDAVFVHVYSVGEMKAQAFYWDVSQELSQEAYLYYLYPKLTNKQGLAGIHRDSIFPSLEVDETTGQVKGTKFYFSRMISLNDTFTIVGMKRLEGAKRKKKNQETVLNYEEAIFEIVTQLGELGPVFTALSPSQQRQWAQQIYSAKRPETVQKRYAKLKVELQTSD